jgi:hypothetical protein
LCCPAGYHRRLPFTFSRNHLGNSGNGDAAERLIRQDDLGLLRNSTAESNDDEECDNQSDEECEYEEVRDPE